MAESGDRNGGGERSDTGVGSEEWMRGPWVDNHCHLGLPSRGGDAPAVHEVLEVLDRARGAGVVAMITVGTDAASSAACLDRAAGTDGVWATAGVHPHDATGGTEALRDLVTSTLTEAGGLADALVAIGECGLDYHYDHSPRAVQRQVFADQVALAHETDLPLVIHTRDAWEDTFAVLDELSIPRRTVFHCFTGGPAQAEASLERGALLSVSGIVTFGSAKDLRDAVAATPLGSLMVETDSPYLAPVPHRGRPNEPRWVGLVGAAVAAVHGVDVTEVARVTTSNAAAFYGLELS